MPRAKWQNTATTSTHSMLSSCQTTCRNKIHTYYNKRAGSDEEVSPFYALLRIISNKPESVIRPLRGSVVKQI